MERVREDKAREYRIEMEAVADWHYWVAQGYEL